MTSAAEAEDNAKRRVEAMVERDPSKAEVVQWMRAAGRTWIKIAQCFRRIQLDGSDAT